MSDLVKVCGLWFGKTEKSQDVLTGNLSYSARIVVMPNTFKEKDTDPDYNLFISKREKQEGEKDGQESQQQRRLSRPPLKQGNDQQGQGYSQSYDEPPIESYADDANEEVPF